MEELIKALTIGVTNGLIIALIAIGYTLVYGILELINFAHADVFMLGTAFTYFATELIVIGMGIPASSTLALLLTLIALPFIMLATAGINAGIERVAYRPLRNAPRLAPLISAIGMSFVLQNVGLMLLGPSQKAVEPVLPRTDILSLPERSGMVRDRRARRRWPSRSHCCSACAGSSAAPARARPCGRPPRTARRPGSWASTSTGRSRSPS